MNDLGFDIIMGGNDYEFMEKTNVDNKKTETSHIIFTKR